MKTKEDIVRDWLPRYTGRKLEEFGQYVLLVNFSNYVEMFAERFGVPVVGRDRPMMSATAENITILSFGMGSAMAGSRRRRSATSCCRSRRSAARERATSTCRLRCRRFRRSGSSAR